MRFALVLAAFLVAGCGGHRSARMLQHVTLRTGEAVRVPSAAVRCEASAEGGLANLFCRRIGGGPTQIAFYPDRALVWTGPEDAHSYAWAGRPSVRVSGGGTGSTPLFPGDTVNAPAAATRCVVGAASLRCTPWPAAGRAAVVFSKRDVTIDRRGVHAASYRWGPTT